MKAPSIHKVIYYLVAAGLICIATKLYLAQQDMETVVTEQKYGWYYKLEDLGDCLISAASVLSFLVYRKYFPLFVSVCYVSIVLIIILISIPYIDYVLKSPSFFYSIRGIGNFINFGLLFFAANVQYFKKVMRIFYFICIAYVIGGFINLGGVGMGAARQDFLYAIRNITVVMIWVFPFFFLQNYEDKRLNIFNTVIFFLIFIFILSTASRTYLIIYFLFIIVKFRQQLSSKKGILVIIGTVIAAAGVFYVLSSSGMSKTMEGAFDVLSERAGEDSRSGQIIEFLRQWDSEYFLQGVGPLKTWYWTNFSDWYAFLDNQFLLTGWWAGLPVLFLYVYLLVRTLFHKAEIQMYKEVKGIQLMIVLWILACLGFAIYITISSSIYYFFIEMLMSHHLCQYSKIKDFDPEEI